MANVGHLCRLRCRVLSVGDNTMGRVLLPFRGFGLRQITASLWRGYRHMWSCTCACACTCTCQAGSSTRTCGRARTVTTVSSDCG